MVQVVILSANGESRTLKTAAIAAGAPVTGAAAAKAIRKTKPASLLGTYKYKGTTMSLWGWDEGKAGTENKHELPPPHDEALFFGDIVVTSSAGDITVDEWLEFYDAAFGGFEDLGSEDSEEEDDADSEEEEDEAEDDEDEDGDAGDDDDEDSAGDDETEEDEDGDADEADSEEEEAEEEEEEDGDDDCYDDEEGGTKRRSPRKRTTTAPEFRRLDMGLKSRVKVPTPPGKRAPRWQTGPELEPEAYE
jgi:hypothetical protein